MTAIVNAMTVDVEDYFHVSAFEGVVRRDAWDSYERRVVANTQRLLDAFERHRVRATFFVLGWVAEREPSLVRAIVAAGHELASHGFAHQLIYEQDRAIFRDDVRKAKALLEQIGGVAIRGYRAPSFSVTPQSRWALDVLIEEGYTYDASIFPIRHDRYGMPGAPRQPYVERASKGTIAEAPGTTISFGPVTMPAAGGGYFRIFPYAFTRWAIRRINAQERRPAIVYLHPWEVDPRQPRIPANPVSRFRHYTNLHRTERRLDRLLRDFRFAPLADILEDLQLLSASRSAA
jgi:polysaccharide deacetylase family protein (PEP-CTERM system associated)